MLSFTEAMHLAVEESGPDFVYNSTADDGCTYTRNGAPDCLVGHAFAIMGIGINEIQLLDFDPAGEAAEAMVRLGVGTEAERFAADIAQQKQDLGDTWGEALEAYEAGLVRFGREFGDL